MEHCWVDDAEFLVESLVEIVGSDLAVMRSNAKITRLGATLDLFCCHMKRLALTGADGMVKLLDGPMARWRDPRPLRSPKQVSFPEQSP